MALHVCLLTVIDGNIYAERDELPPRQQSYCFLYPQGCSTNETGRKKGRGRERENNLSNTCCVLSAEINRFANLTIGLHSEIDYVQSLKGKLNL